MVFSKVGPNQSIEWGQFRVSKSGARRAEGKILIHLRQSAPEVEKRSLAAYERMASGGER
jgi:hypothetical protein